MIVRVQLFSHLRDAAGVAELNLEIADGATVADAIGELYARAPALHAWDNSILVGSGVEFVERNHALKEGEELAIMPPVQGG